jgi:hypothetical protein
MILIMKLLPTLLSFGKGIIDAVPFISTAKNLIKKDNKKDGYLTDDTKNISDETKRPIFGIVKKVDYSRLIGQVVTYLLIIFFVVKNKELTFETLTQILSLIKNFY